MGTISLSLPSDGQTIDAADVNTPFNTISAVINGNIDNDNVKTAADINGSKLLDASIPGKKFDATTYGGWIAGVLPAVSSCTANGNRSYDIVFASTVAALLTPGMRLRTTRTVTAPTQCTDLESGSSQYYSKATPAGMTFTDDFTMMGWYKPESYVAGGIIARRNADTEGWSLGVNASGQVVAWAGRIAGNNSSTTSYQSVSLTKQQHIAASVDLSGTSVLIYIDGVLVPSLTTITGTITALVQGTTDLVVGAEKSAGTNPLDGKLAQAAVFSSVLPAATIRSYMSQTLSGSESTNVSAYSFNNSIVDLNANANNLTAQGSALATNADSPFGINGNGTTSTYDYAIVTKVATTTATVQVPEGCTIPTSGGVSAVDLSPHKNPFNFPGQRSRWQHQWLLKAAALFGAGATNNTWQSGPTNGSLALSVPLGEWAVYYDLGQYVDSGASITHELFSSLSTSNSSESDVQWSTFGKVGNGGTQTYYGRQATRSGYLSLSAATTYYIIGKANSSGAGPGNHQLNIGGTTSSVTADLSYL